MDYSPMSKLAVRWVIDNLAAEGDRIVLIHVQPSKSDCPQRKLWGDKGSRTTTMTTLLYLLLKSLLWFCLLNTVCGTDWFPSELICCFQLWYLSMSLRRWTCRSSTDSVQIPRCSNFLMLRPRPKRHGLLIVSCHYFLMFKVMFLFCFYFQNYPIRNWPTKGFASLFGGGFGFFGWRIRWWSFVL